MHALVDRVTPEALEGLSWAAWWRGDSQTLFDARERAYRLYREGDQPRAAAHMATWLGTDSVDFRGELAVASGWLARARRLLEGDEECSAFGWLCVHEAEQLIYAEDTRRARELGARAASLGAALQSTTLEMMGVAIEGLAMVTEGEVAAGMQGLDEAAAAALGGEFDELVYVAFCSCFVIYACERVRDYERARQWCDRAMEFAARYDMQGFNRLCRAHHAGVLIWRGMWEEAEAELVEARDGLAESRPPMAAEAIVRLGELRRRQGRLAEAEALFAEVDGHLLAPLGQAELALDRGDAGLARDLLERLLRQTPAASRTQRAAALELLVRAEIADGDLDAAEAPLAELRSIAETIPTEPLRACASFAAGISESARGEWSAARRSLEDATHLYQRSGAPFEASRARIALARALSALERPEHAEAQARQAADVLERIGARREAEEAQRLAGEHTGRPLLTKRECEVMRLVAAGQSDREIAAELVLSEHTVHRHVANVLTKLGCRSRSAAVAEAVRRALV